MTFHDLISTFTISTAVSDFSPTVFVVSQNVLCIHVRIRQLQLDGSILLNNYKALDKHVQK